MTTPSPHQPKSAHLQDLYRGCLLGGAVGDALGAPVEFMSRAQILRTFGPDGIEDYAPAFGKLAAITDDTQMTLFTAEGLMRGWVRGNRRGGLCHMPSVISLAYQRWLHTQGERHRLHDEDCLNGWLIEHRELFARRAPGLTCLSGLQSMRQSGDMAQNNSKGCGGVMRVAPIGMVYASLARANPANQGGGRREAFELGCQAAAITHGHTTGQLASGALAAMVLELLQGVSLLQAVDAVLPVLRAQPGHEETLLALEAACRLALEKPGDAQVLAQLGEGWIAEEALAIGVYGALSATDFSSGVALAVNHSGDSDSTGSIAGQLLGAMLGARAIPRHWLGPLELREVIEEMADDLATLMEWSLEGEDSPEDVDYYAQKYPGV